MSSAGRKHKQYQQMKRDQKLFGNISAKNEYGVSDLVAYSAGRGEIFISRSQIDLGRMPVKKKSDTVKSLGKAQ